LALDKKYGPRIYTEKYRKRIYFITYSERNHTFVVCAYKESPYLSECIDSLLNQTKKGEIIISTSTPNSYIQEIAEKYHLPIYVNTGKTSIADDWNFGCSKVRTELFTIAHQDDLYEKEYLQKILENVNQSEEPLIAFTDYYELRNGKLCRDNTLLKVKRLMLKPLTIRRFWKSKWIRRRVLSFGDAICCPSVTFVKDRLPEKIFTFGYRSDVDWQAWEKISRMKGSFVYVDKPLMCHRIHEESETSKILGEHARKQEDYEMFCKFWPRPVAKCLIKLYEFAEHSNES